MKKINSVALLALASFILAGSASAQTLSRAPQYQLTQYSAPMPPVPVMAVCAVRGVRYPVDYDYQVWGRDQKHRRVDCGRPATL